MMSSFIIVHPSIKINQRSESTDWCSWDRFIELSSATSSSVVSKPSLSRKKALKKLLRYIEGRADNRVYLKKNGLWDYIIWHYAFILIMITQEVGCMVLFFQLDFNWIQQEYCNFKPIETISRKKTFSLE